MASKQPLGVCFDFEGRTFVRRADGVHRVAGLPDHEAPVDWPEIAELALSLGGYREWGSFDECAEVAARVHARFDATGRIDAANREVRAALFFEQRRFRHYGWPPEERDMPFIRALVAALGT